MSQISSEITFLAHFSDFPRIFSEGELSERFGGFENGQVGELSERAI